MQAANLPPPVNAYIPIAGIRVQCRAYLYMSFLSFRGFLVEGSVSCCFCGCTLCELFS